MIEATRMVINHWSADFTRRFGHIFPESYLAFDCEYTGRNAEKDLILEIGHVLVENRMMVDRLGLVLDWTNHPIVPDHWLRAALRRSEKRAAAAGYHHRITYEVMKEEGVRPPEKVLQFYLDLFHRIKHGVGFFAAHNGYNADVPMLRGAFEGFLNKDFDFGSNNLFDTGGLEKASQCLISEDRQIRERHDTWLPRTGDTLATYFRRVTNSPAKGIFWRLDLCVEKYGLVEKYDLDMSQHHTADFDAYVVYLLMEELRKLIRHDNSGEDPTASPEALGRMVEQELAKSRHRQAKEERRNAGVLARRRKRGQRVL